MSVAWPVAPARRSGGWLAGAAFDPARLYHEDRSLKNITEMDDDTRAAIASIEIDESKVDGVVVGHTTKIKLWDKNRAWKWR